MNNTPSSISLRVNSFKNARYQEKAAMKKTIKMHEEKDGKQKDKDSVPKGAVPSSAAY